MKYLSQGQEAVKKINLLMELTSTGDNIRAAIIDHLTRNFSISEAAMLNDVKPGNLSVAIVSLNKVAEIVEKINEHKLYG
jgi:hypothetical protein